jgi:hypothetical protein
MNPSLLPYIAAAVAISAFLVVRQGLRHQLGHGPSTLVGAMLAGLVYYAAYLYQDEVLAGVSIPDGLFPLALLVALILLAIATLSRRRPPSQIQGAPRGSRQMPGSPLGTVDNEAQPLPGRLGRGRPHGQFRPASRYDRYDDERQYPRRPARAYRDERYPDDD